MLGDELDAPPLGFDPWDATLEAFGGPQEERNMTSAAQAEGHGPRLFFQQVPRASPSRTGLHLDVRGDVRAVPRATSGWPR